MHKKEVKQSKQILTCVRGHTGRFIETWNGKNKIWYMACAECKCGVYWSGGVSVS